MALEDTQPWPVEPDRSFYDQVRAASPICATSKNTLPTSPRNRRKPLVSKGRRSSSRASFLRPSP